MANELPATCNTCFTNNEKATTRDKFQVKPIPGGRTEIGGPAGLLCFKIIPLDALDDPNYNPNSIDPGNVSYGAADYDFLLFKISPMQFATGGSCTAIKTRTAFGMANSVIARCNWTGTHGPTGLFGPGTGTVLTLTDTSLNVNRFLESMSQLDTTHLQPDSKPAGNKDIKNIEGEVVNQTFVHLNKQ